MTTTTSQALSLEAAPALNATQQRRLCQTEKPALCKHTHRNRRGARCRVPPCGRADRLCSLLYARPRSCCRADASSCVTHRRADAAFERGAARGAVGVCGARPGTRRQRRLGGPLPPYFPACRAGLCGQRHRRVGAEQDAAALRRLRQCDATVQRPGARAGVPLEQHGASSDPSSAAATDCRGGGGGGSGGSGGALALRSSLPPSRFTVLSPAADSQWPGQHAGVLPHHTWHGGVARPRWVLQPQCAALRTPPGAVPLQSGALFQWAFRILLGLECRHRRRGARRHGEPRAR